MGAREKQVLATTLLATTAVVGLLFGAVNAARADESTGTYTGAVELRTNYYWETSTRVVAPEVYAHLDTPAGVRIEAGYLLDAITSASIAAGVQEDIRFTEVRNQGTLGLSREFDLGGAYLRLNTSGRISHEPDYLSGGTTLGGTLSWNQRASVLSLQLGYLHDDVGQVFRGGEMRVDDMGRDLSDRGRQGQLEAVTASLSFNQVLTPTDTATIGYQLIYNWGFLQNVYRRVILDGSPEPEQHPRERVRQTVFGRLAHFFPETSTAIHVMLRAYADDWGVLALTPEVRGYQMLGDSVVVRLSYRYYAQSASYFDQRTYEAGTELRTADQKLSQFNSHLLGAQLRVGLTFLSGSPLDFLDRAWIDFSFNYWFQTSRFGDAVLAQAALRSPF